MNETVLVTGATGYIGGRLVGRLLSAGYKVRTLVRDPQRLQGRPWADLVEAVQGDVLERPDCSASYTWGGWANRIPRFPHTCALANKRGQC